MKTIKTFAFTIFLLAAINATAQNDTAIAKKRTDYITQHVSGITPGQASKILSIEQNCSSAMHGATNTRMKDSVRKSSAARMKRVLTFRQYIQYKRIKKGLPKDNKDSY